MGIFVSGTRFDQPGFMAMMEEVEDDNVDTEERKARDPMRWVGLINCCKAQVEEIVFAELIYC